MPMPALTIPDVIGAGLAAEARDRLERAGYTRYRLLDRGSYEYIDAPDLPHLVEALHGVASEVAARELVVAQARVVRLLPGDFIFVRHDRVHDDRPVEVVLDLSSSPTSAAEIHYRHRGQVFFVAPSRPGALTLVERGPTVMCNHTYVSKLEANASVVRFILLMRATAPA
jgi:hypothetical protein